MKRYRGGDLAVIIKHPTPVVERDDHRIELSDLDQALECLMIPAGKVCLDGGLVCFVGGVSKSKKAAEALDDPSWPSKAKS